jgi:hypothetical protein
MIASSTEGLLYFGLPIGLVILTYGQLGGGGGGLEFNMTRTFARALSAPNVRGPTGALHPATLGLKDDPEKRYVP